MSQPAPDELAVTLRRSINEEVVNVAERFGEGKEEELLFVCECGSLRCQATVKLTLIEFLACPPGSVVGHRPGRPVS